MIIKINSSKDTFITNLKNNYNDGSKSNFGACSTLDIFKLYNENKHSQSKIFLEVNNVAIDNDSTIKLTDYQGRQAVITFDNLTNTDNAAIKDDNGFYVVGTVDGTQAYASQIGKTIIALREEKIIDIDASFYNNYLVLTQGYKGEEGDTLIELTGNASDVLLSKTLSYKFSRIEHGCVLIKFDFDNINEILNNIDFDNSAFNGLKAEVLLKDVSTGTQKPKGFDIVAHSLNKDFDEGIGKDIKNMSDIGEANFYKINSSESLDIYEFLIPDVDYSNNVLDTFRVTKGNENISLDVSEFIKSVIKGEADNNGLLIKISDDYLYDEKTYFAKRSGSRHLLNKRFIPELNLSIQDDLYEVPTFTKNRNIEEETQDFYLHNNTNQNFFFPTDANGNLYNEIRAKIKLKDATEYLTDLLTLNLNNYKGNQVTNIKTISVPREVFSKSDIYSKITNEGLEFDVTWYYSNNEQALKDLVIKTDTHVLFKNNDSLNNYEKEYVILKFSKDLTANNSVYNGMLYMIDPTKRQAASRESIQIKSNKYSGDIFYKVLNNEDGSVLCDYSTATRTFYDGEKYIFNYFIPEYYKNMTIRFEFKIVTDKHTSYVANNNQTFRID